jgi:hypothetical protein
MKKILFFILICLSLNLVVFAQKQPNLKVMFSMGKPGKAAIDTNSVNRKGDLVYFDLYYVEIMTRKDISYVFHKYEMNCINGDWLIIEMFDMTKKNERIDKDFARKEPFPRTDESDIFYKFVCKNK